MKSAIGRQPSAAPVRPTGVLRGAGVPAGFAPRALRRVRAPARGANGMLAARTVLRRLPTSSQ
jgi:hypothetical protein